MNLNIDTVDIIDFITITLLFFLESNSKKSVIFFLLNLFEIILEINFILFSNLNIICIPKLVAHSKRFKGINTFFHKTFNYIF